jgi:hypothetical protein
MLGPGLHRSLHGQSGDGGDRTCRTITKSCGDVTLLFTSKTGRPRKNLDAKRILALRAQGLSWRMIAKRMQVGIGTSFRAARGRSKSVS